MAVCELAGRVPEAVKVRCPRCGFAGDANEGRQVPANGSVYVYCPKCDGPCDEAAAKPKGKADGV